MVIENEILENASLSQELSIDHPLGRDEFIYDLIGINIIGLKSLGVLFKRPADYFKAALTPDWEGKYWPSMRMWFGFMTIMVALQFIWASESSEMTAMFRTMAGSIADGAIQGAERDGKTLDLSQFDRVAEGKRTFKTYIFIYPFFFISFMCLLGFIFRGWETKIPFIARVRFIFAIIIPGTVIGLFSTMLMVPFKGLTYQILSFVSLGLIFLTYWLTAYRGAYFNSEQGTRIGMSFVISILIIITLMIAQFLAMCLALIPSAMDLIEIIKAQK